MLTVQKTVAAWLGLPGVRAAAVPAGMTPAKFDLDVSVAEMFGADGAAGGLRGAVIVSADLFDAAAAGGIAARLVRVLDVVAGDPGVSVRLVGVLGAEERRQVLAGWNDTSVGVAAATLGELFA